MEGKGGVLKRGEGGREGDRGSCFITPLLMGVLSVQESVAWVHAKSCSALGSWRHASAVPPTNCYDHGSDVP